jgi:hypothetical protein
MFEKHWLSYRASECISLATYMVNLCVKNEWCIDDWITYLIDLKCLLTALKLWTNAAKLITQWRNSEKILLTEHLLKIKICLPLSEIWGSHRGKDVNDRPLGCNTGWSVSRYRRFGGKYSLHLQGWRWSQYIRPKRWSLQEVHTALQFRLPQLTTPVLKGRELEVGRER